MNENDPFSEKPYDASDPQAVNLARKRAGRRKSQHNKVVKALMEISEGRMWLYDLMNSCHVYSTSYVYESERATCFQEGERNIGNRILSDIQEVATDAEYVSMIREAKNREKIERSGQS